MLGMGQVLLGRYSRSEDVVSGTPLANRNQPELEGLIGYFVNPVALRTNLSGAHKGRGTPDLPSSQLHEIWRAARKWSSLAYSTPWQTQVSALIYIIVSLKPQRETGTLTELDMYNA